MKKWILIIATLSFQLHGLEIERVILAEESPIDEEVLAIKRILAVKEHKRRYSEIFLEKVASDKSSPYLRALLTLSCEDADAIPKVENAGEISTDAKGTWQLMHNGVKVVKDGYYAPWMTDLICGLQGHHEPQEEKIFHEVLKQIPERATMIELGSYWGYYSLWFASAILEAKNYLVEPSKEHLEIGKRNFALNGKQGHFYHAYAGARMDAIDYTGARHIAIDRFLEHEQIPHVDILHADIQGGEFEMLKDCSRSIAEGKIDFLFVSTHSDELHYKCVEFLRANGCVIIAEHSMSESYSVDGLIVAKRKGIGGSDHIAVSKRPLSDTELLEAVLERKMDPAQHAFYQGISLASCGKYAEAIESFAKRLTLPSANAQETYVAAFNLAAMYEALGKTEEAINCYLKAYLFRPTRAEPLHQAAVLYRKGGKHLLGYLLEKHALSIPCPAEELCIDAAVYEHGILIELANCALLMGDYKEGYRACNTLLAKVTLPENIRPLVERNQKLAKANLGEKCGVD